MMLSELWYFGAFSQQISTGQHLHVEMLGIPILIGRDFTGKVFAVRDICPHRGILLSSGQLIDDGGKTRIECPYHGWRFGTDGRCAFIPSLTHEQAKTKDLGKIGTRSFAVREQQGLIWVYHGEAKPKTNPIQLDLVGENKPGLITKTHFDCSIDHAVIGLMDPAHIAFIHRQWWWRSGKSIHEKAKNFGPVPFGFSMLPHQPSSNSYLYQLLGGKPQTEIRFQLPGIRVEYVKVADKYVVGFTAVTPINETTTRISIGLYWNHPVVSLFPKRLIRKGLDTFVGQDRDAVNAQQKGLAYDPKLMLIHDSDVQAKWYFALKKEWNKSQRDGKPFQNPVQAKTLRWRS